MKTQIGLIWKLLGLDLWPIESEITLRKNDSSNSSDTGLTDIQDVQLNTRDSFKRTKFPCLLLNGYIIIMVAQSWISFAYTKIASAAVQGEFWLWRLVSHRKKRYSKKLSTHNHISEINEVRPTKLMNLFSNNTEKGWHYVVLDQISAKWDP